MRTHLKPDGLIAFESRKFLNWSGSRMSFELCYRFPEEKLISSSQLRFWSVNEIARHLLESGLRIERLMGDWDLGEFKESSTEEMVFFVRVKVVCQTKRCFRKYHTSHC